MTKIKTYSEFLNEGEIHIFDKLGEPLTAIGTAIEELLKDADKIEDPKWIAALKGIQTQWKKLDDTIGKADSRLGIIPIKESEINEANYGELFDLVKNGFGWATIEWVRQCPINRAGRLALAQSLAKAGMLYDDADLKDEHINGEVDPGRGDGIKPMTVADLKKHGL
jgi:hypothetical protein